MQGPFTTGLLPYVAKDIYHVDQTGLGYLLASFNSGALAGSVTLMLFGDRISVPMLRVTLVAAVGWYALLLMFGQADHATAGMTYLVLAGFMQSICMVALVVTTMRRVRRSSVDSSRVTRSASGRSLRSTIATRGIHRGDRRRCSESQSSVAHTSNPRSINCARISARSGHWAASSTISAP